MGPAPPQAVAQGRNRKSAPSRWLLLLLCLLDSRPNSSRRPWAFGLQRIFSHAVRSHLPAHPVIPQAPVRRAGHHAIHAFVGQGNSPRIGLYEEMTAHPHTHATPIPASHARTRIPARASSLCGVIPYWAVILFQPKKRGAYMNCIKIIIAPS